MSEQEKEELNTSVSNIARDVLSIKRWWPVAAFLASMVTCAFTIGWWAYKYDSNVAKRPDIIALSNKVDSLSHKLDRYESAGQVHEHKQDSIETMVKVKADSNRQDINRMKKQITALQARRMVSTGTWMHTFDKNGNVRPGQDVIRNK